MSGPLSKWAKLDKGYSLSNWSQNGKTKRVIFLITSLNAHPPSPSLPTVPSSDNYSLADHHAVPVSVVNSLLGHTNKRMAPLKKKRYRERIAFVELGPYAGKAQRCNELQIGIDSLASRGALIKAPYEGYEVQVRILVKGHCTCSNKAERNAKKNKEKSP